MDLSQRLLLKHRAMDSGITPITRIVNQGEVFKNADNTGDDNPKVGSCWKEYWQIFTQMDFPMTCPICGQPLAKEDISGCHINIRRTRMFPNEDQEKYYYENAAYIIPGHQDCNKKSEKENPFNSAIEVKAVEAIKK